MRAAYDALRPLFPGLKSLSNGGRLALVRSCKMERHLQSAGSSHRKPEGARGRWCDPKAEPLFEPSPAPFDGFIGRLFYLQDRDLLLLDFLNRPTKVGVDAKTLRSA